MKFRRRIRRSPSGESCPEELKSQDLWPAREVVWERVRAEHRRRVYRRLTPKVRRRNVQGAESDSQWPKSSGRGHPPFRGAGGSSLHSQSAAPTGQCRHHRPDGGAGWRQRGVKQLNAFWSCLAFHTFVYCYARLSENYASLNNALRERWCCRLGGGGPPGKHSPHKGLSSRPEGDASLAFSPGFGRTACTASSAGRDCGEIGAGSDRQVRTKLTSVKSGTCEWKKTPRTGERCRRYPGTSPASPERKDAPPMPR